jgi:hypothetical protein
MHHRLIAILALLCFAFGGGGCELFQPSKKPKSSSKKKRYKEVLMPLQTGSNLQRRAYIEQSDDIEPAKKPRKKKSPSPKPDAEPSETPPPTEEESPAPTPERFR